MFCHFLWHELSTILTTYSIHRRYGAKVSIIGVGGIIAPEHAYDLILTGAVYEGPGLDAHFLQLRKSIELPWEKDHKTAMAAAKARWAVVEDPPGEQTADSGFAWTYFPSTE
jgi:hypothetical protein